MADTIVLTEITGRFDGTHIVPDEPVDLPVGTRLRVQVRAETAEEIKERQLAAIRRFSGSGKALPKVDPRYLDTRESYYD